MIEGCGDGAILQQHGRPSELPFCCKRGHSAILPYLQFLPAACSSRFASGVWKSWGPVSLGSNAEAESHAMDIACRACRGVGRQGPLRCMRSIPSLRSLALTGRMGATGRTAWAVRRHRVEASDGLKVVVDLAMSSAKATGEMKRRQPVSALAVRHGLPRWGRARGSCMVSAAKGSRTRMLPAESFFSGCPVEPLRVPKRPKRPAGCRGAVWQGSPTLKVG